MKKAVLISLFLVLVTSLWAQSSEWTEYCRLQKMVRYEELSSDSAYSIYYKMDSIYSGIPSYLDLFSYLKIAIACNKQEKMKELAFRLIRWMCFDNRLFDNPKMEPLKQMEFWAELDSLAKMHCDKRQYTDYMRKLYEMQISDQQCRKPLHQPLNQEERDSVWQIIRQTDSLNLEQLKDLIELYGFPTWEKVGNHYAFCAWLIAQHAEPDFLQYYVEQMKKAVANDNASRSELAYMIDRDLMNRDLPQLYGTQSIGVYLEDNTLENRLWIVEDLEQLNDRRENMLLEPLDLSKIKVYDEKEMFRDGN